MTLRRDLPVFPVVPDAASVGTATVLREEGATAGDGPSIALITLGCDKNTVDSERMMAALVGHGATVSSEVVGADVVIVNTCGFIQSAKEQSIETILEACALKEEGRIRAVAAVGCMVQRHGEELAREIPEVDLYLGLTELDTLVPELRRRGHLPAEGSAVPLMERPLRLLTTGTGHTSFLKISEGCDHKCAFCAIPLMRGLHRSHPLEELVREADGLGQAGVRELNVVSQDTTWYGRDLRRHDRSAPLLPELLRALLAGSSVPWYRLFYMYPSGITDEMIELIASEPRILPYLDMPIQHGSDRMLEAMRRPERQERIRDRVARLRAAIPGITLRTTVIVGFPGESDEDFRRMLDLLEELEIDRVGAFTYSHEEGTAAAQLSGSVPQELMDDRLEELMELQRGISFDRNQRLVGDTVTVLVDEVTEGAEGGAVGRTAGQAIDVDGVTHLVGAVPGRAGTFVQARVVEAGDYDLTAEVLAGATTALVDGAAAPPSDPS